MSMPTEDRPGLQDRVPAIVYTALLIFLLSSAVLVRMSAAIRVGYAVCAAVALGLPVLLMLGKAPPSRRLRNGALLAAVGSSLFLLPALILSEGRSLLHVAVDFCTTLLPIGFVVVGLTVPATFRRLLERRWLLAFGLSALLAPWLIRAPEYARAFEPPDVGVIALFAAVASRGADARDRAGAAIGLLVLTVLAGMSGSRSILFIALLAFAVTLPNNRTARWLAAAMLAAALVIGIVDRDAVLAGWNADSGSRSVPRALTLFRGGRVDASTSSRLREMRLLFDEMRDRSPLWTVFGSGHGAVFEPDEWHSERTISDDGYVHNVHFGPQLMLFRYGVAGLALYVALLLHAASVAWACLRERDAPEGATPRLLFALGTTLYLIEFLFRSVLPNPVFSFFLAGHLGVTLGTPRHQADRASDAQSASENSPRRRPQITG